MFWGIISLALATWICADSYTLGFDKIAANRDIWTLHPWAWFALTFIIWPVGFPLYLVARGRFKRMEE